MASKEENRIAAQKLQEGKSLDQNEERALARARSTTGTEKRLLDRIVAGEKR